MSHDERVLKFYEVTSGRVRNHHNALWEEEKHYSWWVYVLFVGVVSLYIFANLDNFPKLTLIIAGCCYGLYLSIAAVMIIRREGEQFHEALEMRNRAILALGLYKPIPIQYSGRNIVLTLTPEIEIHKDFDVKTLHANKGFREFCKAAYRCKLGIRDIFQLSFVLASVLFILLIIISCMTIGTKL